MSYIACTGNCVYQKEGYCRLARVPETPDCVGTAACAYMKPASAISSQNSEDSLSDITHEYNF